MPLFHDLILSATSANSLSAFLSEKIQSFHNLHNSNIERLYEEKNDIRDFIESKRLVFEQLDFTTNTNRAFVSILFDFAERFGFGAFVTIENIQRRNNLYLGKRREAAKLFLLGIRNNNDYIERYDAICSLLQSSLETEEDTNKDVISTFFNYYAKVVYDTAPSTEFSEAVKGKLIASRQNQALTFLQNEYLSNLLTIDISDSESAYFAIHTLIDEIFERDYTIEEVVTEKEYLIEEDTEYENSLDSDTFSFNRIRQIAVEKSNWNDFLPHRGVLPLESEGEMFTYLKSVGPMHKAKLNSCFEALQFNEINNSVEIIDWGCGQALATIVFSDFLKDRNLNQLHFDKIILIEPSELCLKRAALHAMLTGITQNVKTVCKGFNHLLNTDVATNQNTTKIHLLSNVIDIDEAIFSQDQLIELIKNSQSGENYFVCSSPYITDYKTNKIDNFVRSFENRRMLLSIDERTGQWRGTNWSRVLRVFKTSL